MTACVEPPPLTPDEVNAAAEGTAPPRVLEHLARCPHCAGLLEALQTFDARLAAGLHRWDCPPTLALADHLLGRAQPAVANHVAGCARCQAELAEMQAFLTASDEPVATPTATRQPTPPSRPNWRELVARLLPQPPAMQLRGGVTRALIAQAGDDLTLLLELEPTAAGSVMVTGQLAAPDQARWAGALAQLLQAGRPVATALLDELGGFRLEASPPGPVDLRLTPAAGPVVVLHALDLGGKPSAAA